MEALIEDTRGLLSPAGDGAWLLPPDRVQTPVEESDERLARRALREQIAKIERELAGLFGSAHRGRDLAWGVAEPGGPRLLDLGELESLRDSLANRLQDVRRTLEERGYVEQQNRELIERMFVEPERYHWVRVSNEDIGEPGCRHWHSRPRYGLLGMLMGWWRVKVSSGCP